MKAKKIHTVESLHAMCVDEGDCWNWQGYMANKSPYINHNGVMQSVRRLLFTLTDRQPMPKAKYYASNCGNPSCVNPDHLTSRSAKLHAKIMGKKVDQNALLRRLKLQKSSRNRAASKLTRELADQIFADPRPSRAIAVDFDISRATVSNIKSGKSWKNLSATTNPWVGLL
tara:strand:+ start:2765 stop:3277 length:513 start_codon:yes stop_codon:yes gene_type:complete